MLWATRILPAKALARTILNEVTSSNRSHIQGYIEVSGHKADVILANPNGITINGGGFINTGRATVTTGKPEFDGAGALRSFEVRQGDVRIEGDGINANNITAFDIVSRAAEINAEIYANELNIVTGQNSYDPATGAATALDDDGSAKPALAIDSSALGGMYAGRIKLTSNEKGVGVNLQGVVQSVNDMEITSEGRLALRAAKSGGSITLASTGDIVLEEAALANKNLTARAKNVNLNNASSIGAANKLDIQTTGNLYASNGAEAAGGELLQVSAADVKLADDALFHGKNVNLQVNSLTLDDNASLEGNSVTVEASDEVAINGGTLLAGKSALIKAGSVTNSGLIYAGDAIDFKVNNTLSNRNGADILAGGNIRFSGLTAGSRMEMLHNQSSGIESIDGNISVYAGTVFNDGGTPVTQRVKDGYDYKIIGWYGDFSIPRGENTAWYNPAVLNDPTVPYYAYGPNGQKNYLRNRTYLNKCEWYVWAYVRDQNELYGIPAQRAGKAEGMQEWKEYYHDELVSPASPSMFMAGGDIFMDVGELTNTYSAISAGGDIGIQADKFTNKGLELSSYTDIERAFLSTGSRGTYTIERIDRLFYYYSELIDTIPAAISAGGTVTIDAAEEVNNSIVKSGEDYAGTSSGFPGFSGFPNGGSWQDDAQWMPELNLGGLFKSSTNPGHKYLIETNPKLASLSGFYGSEYFLGRVGYDLDREQSRLLGDAFFETRFVRDQILAQSGQRYLFDGITNDADIMLRLMDNAAAMQSGLGLSVGVSLTPEQIAGLTHDIIWLEEQEYSGHTVLVPRLYLCDATKAELAVRGSNISGTDVAINSADINNQGDISGNNVVLTASNDVINRGGSILGSNALVVNADGSILNHSGTLAGGDITLLAGKDVSFETLVDQQKSGKYDNVPKIGQTAHINSSGNLNVQAGNNITLAGADVKVEGEANLNAAGDVLIGSQAITMAGGTEGSRKTTKTANFLGRERTITTVRSHNSNYSHTTQAGSNMDAGELNINAGNNIAVVGSSVNARDGATLNAGQDINIAAAREESHSYYHTKKKGGFLRSTKKKTIRSDTITAKESSVSSDGWITLDAGGNITVGGSNIIAGNFGSGDLNISSANDVIVGAVTESSSNYSKSSRKGVLSSSGKSSINVTTTNVGSLLAGENVNINANNNIIVSGSDIAARNDINLDAQTGDVVIASAQDATYSDSKKYKKGFGIFTGGGSIDIYRSEKEKNNRQTTTNVASSLDAGGNINVAEARDITSIGSQIGSGEDINLNAGRDVNILAGSNSDYCGQAKRARLSA